MLVRRLHPHQIYCVGKTSLFHVQPRLLSIIVFPQDPSAILSIKSSRLNSRIVEGGSQASLPLGPSLSPPPLPLPSHFAPPTVELPGMITTNQLTGSRRLVVHRTLFFPLSLTWSKLCDEARAGVDHVNSGGCMKGLHATPAASLQGLLKGKPICYTFFLSHLKLLWAVATFPTHSNSQITFL